MAELLDAVLTLGTDPANMRSLAKRCDLGSSEVAGTLHDLAARLSIRGLTMGLNTPAGDEDLLVLARGFHWVDRDQPARLFSNADNAISEELTQRAFGRELDPSVANLAGQAGVSERSAQTALEIAVGITVLMAAAATGGEMSEASLVKISDEWSGPLPEPLDEVVEKQRADDAPPVHPGEEAGKRRPWIPLAAAGVAILAIGVVVLQLGDDSSETDTDAVAVSDLALVAPEETTPTDVSDADANPEQSKADATEDETGDELGTDEPVTETIEPPSPIVSLRVPMTDTVNLDNDAAGTLNFDFNTETGEVCYSVTSQNVQGPYRSHIHVGGAGEKGGIVVDLGPLDNGATGCLPGLPSDIEAMLTDREGHYAELHDLSEDWTIRAQLSEGTEGPFSTNIEFEVGSGGASIVIDDDNILLEGQVSDQETAAGLAASFAGLGQGITVTSNLEIVSDAPAPSGRIFLAGAAFGANSADMPQVSAATETTLTALLESQGDWSLTAVGRTDGLGSELDNLELSLRRARTLRSFLADLGISEERVRVRGAGEIDADLDDTSSASSRRAEFEFVPE